MFADYSSKDDITRIFLLLRLAMSMELYNMWHEASVEEVRENHNVMVFKELLMAGDVEINPGPYPPGIINFTIGFLKGTYKPLIS